MKLTHLLIIFAVIVGLLSFLSFYKETQTRALDSLEEKGDGVEASAETAAAPTQEPSQTATTTKFVPRSFKGPTGEPRIIGPKGPPPNY